MAKERELRTPVYDQGCSKIRTFFSVNSENSKVVFALLSGCHDAAHTLLIK